MQVREITITGDCQTAIVRYAKGSNRRMIEIVDFVNKGIIGKLTVNCNDDDRWLISSNVHCFLEGCAGTHGDILQVYNMLEMFMR